MDLIGSKLIFSGQMLTQHGMQGKDSSASVSDNVFADNLSTEMTRGEIRLEEADAQREQSRRRADEALENYQDAAELYAQLNNKAWEYRLQRSNEEWNQWLEERDEAYEAIQERNHVQSQEQNEDLKWQKQSKREELNEEEDFRINVRNMAGGSTNYANTFRESSSAGIIALKTMMTGLSNMREETEASNAFKMQRGLEKYEASWSEY